MKRIVSAFLLLNGSLFAIPPGVCFEGDCQNGVGASNLEKAEGQPQPVYRGEFKNGKIHGKGTVEVGNAKIEATFKNGDPVEGKEWVSGALVFEGYWFPNGRWMSGKHYHTDRVGRLCVYDGGFKDDEFHGIGTLTCDGVVMYQGKWNMGKRDFDVTADFVHRSAAYPSQWVGGRVRLTVRLKEQLDRGFLADHLYMDEVGPAFPDFATSDLVVKAYIPTTDCCGLNAILFAEPNVAAKLRQKLSSPDSTVIIVGQIRSGFARHDAQKFEPVIEVTSVLSK